MSSEQIDVHLHEDMIAQQRWHMLMKPRWSMLKFRLSWNKGLSEYLEGKIYLPIFGPITTTESRLIVARDAKITHYDNTKYEEQMFFFNTVLRPSLYHHTVSGVGSEGLDHCYDCTSEIHVLRNYLLLDSGSHHPHGDKVEDVIVSLSKEISRSISPVRTLLSPNPDPGERQKKIRSRQMIGGHAAYLLASQNLD